MTWILWVMGTHVSAIRSVSYLDDMQEAHVLMSHVCGSGLMNWMVRMSAELEVSMNSVERVIEYLPLPSEAPAIVPGKRPPPSWPSAGVITVQNLVVRYRPELPAVINNLSFSTRSHEKVQSLQI